MKGSEARAGLSREYTHPQNAPHYCTQMADPEATLAGFGLALSLGCEQSDLASVRHYMEQLERDQQAGVEGALLCAGVEALPLRRTKQELEATFAVNVLSHFIIAVELAARAVQSRRALRLVSDVKRSIRQ